MKNILKKNNFQIGRIKIMIKSIKNNWFVILFYFALISSIVGAVVFFCVSPNWKLGSVIFYYSELVCVMILWGAILVSFYLERKR